MASEGRICHAVDGGTLICIFSPYDGIWGDEPVYYHRSPPTNVMLVSGGPNYAYSRGTETPEKDSIAHSGVHIYYDLTGYQVPVIMLQGYIFRGDSK